MKTAVLKIFCCCMAVLALAGCAKKEAQELLLEVGRTADREEVQEKTKDSVEEVSEKGRQGDGDIPSASLAGEASPAGGVSEEASRQDLTTPPPKTEAPQCCCGCGGQCAAGSPVQAQVLDDGKININTADETTLQQLNGIGKARAQAIIAYRNAQGPFTSIEEIQNVEGIKEGVFSKIKDQISVG